MKKGHWPAAAVAAAAAFACAAPASASTEQALPANATFPAVTRSAVTIDAPLPSSLGAPPACQELHAYRFRRAGGPASPSDADAVFVAMPGVLAGASSIEMHGLSVVQQAADAGRSVEVWAIDRRANCVEDRTGLDAAASAGDINAAVNYYLNGKPASGRTFDGFKKSGQLPFLAGFDLKQTLEDYRTVITTAVPDPDVRRQKLFCGGHSLGGLLTGLLMSWDFDGNARTTDDAGYRLCAGSIALDSMVYAGDLVDETKTLVEPALDGAGVLDYRRVTDFVNRSFRTADLGVIGPQTMTLLKVIGLNADIAPDADTAPMIAGISKGGTVDQALRLFHSQTAKDALAPVARLRRQHLTGDALLGAFMDDNSQPLAFIRASFGSFDRGPVGRRHFPLSGPSLLFPTGTGLYGWANYDESLPSLLRDDGTPYTSSASEVTDVRDLARVLHEGPLDFLEAYFPTRIVTDVEFALAGSRQGDLRHILYVDAPRTLPRLTVTAGESDIMATKPPVPSLGSAANEHLTVAGYNHNDVILAAPVTHDGAPEPTASAVSHFIVGQVGAATRPSVQVRTGRASDATVRARLKDAAR
ncbi:MAG: hypothetical protein JHC95_10295 [Solirubrobacteraceae bacterium]|nr:hypothetical protein [Solirubrobacteraceae bacterium]